MSKALNLEILKNNSIQVPDGFTLSAEHYHLSVKPLLSRIVDAVKNATPIAELFRTLIISDETNKYIENQLLKLSGARRFAVRSSGNIVQSGRTVEEDSHANALAGQFDSFLNVPVNLVPKAIVMCWASLFNDRSIIGFNVDSDYIYRSGMSVVVQEMIPAKASAVMMTCDPVGNGETGALEFTWGACEAIVAGIVNPDEAVFSRGSRKILSTRVGTKSFQIEYIDFSCVSENAKRIPISEYCSSRLALSEKNIQDLINIGQRVEEIFDCPQDIEAVITPDDKVIITQARPITMLPTMYSPFN